MKKEGWCLDLMQGPSWSWRPLRWLEYQELVPWLLSAYPCLRVRWQWGRGSHSRSPALFPTSIIYDMDTPVKDVYTTGWMAVDSQAAAITVQMCCSFLGPQLPLKQLRVFKGKASLRFSGNASEGLEWSLMGPIGFVFSYSSSPNHKNDVVNEKRLVILHCCSNYV